MFNKVTWAPQGKYTVGIEPLTGPEISLLKAWKLVMGKRGSPFLEPLFEGKHQKVIVPIFAKSILFPFILCLFLFESCNR